MKFAQTFSEELRSHEYPPEWQDAAIRYRQLKKCIKRIMKELEQLGLNANALRLLQATGIQGQVHSQQQQQQQTEDAERKDLSEAMLMIWDRTVQGEDNSNTNTSEDGGDERLRFEQVLSDMASRAYSFSSSSGCSSDSFISEAEAFKEGTEDSEGQADREDLEREVDKMEDNNETAAGLSTNKKSVMINRSKSEIPGVTLQYLFDGTLHAFSPKLVLTIDEKQGIPSDLGLSPQARVALERLVTSQRDGIASARKLHEDSLAGPQEEAKLGLPKTFPDTIHTELEESIGHAENLDIRSNDGVAMEGNLGEPSSSEQASRSHRKIQIPLSADAEFFKLLTSKIITLDIVQSKEEEEISTQVVALGDKVTDVTKPQQFTSHSDLYPWREIFRIYVESGIFFNTTETDRGQRPVEKAEENMRFWLAQVQKNGLTRQFRHKNSQALFGHFVNINMAIMRLLRFQSINRMAMTKILKKFDKRTSLGAREKYPSFISTDPFLSHHLAKALCFTLTTRLLCLIPQLDDYLCPICSSISVKPVRLSCTHVFCVRCLVKLQRAATKACPICRSPVVLKANASNLDVGLLNFLMSYFPKESKEKQAENVREVKLEMWRGVSGQKREPPSCVTM